MAHGKVWSKCRAADEVKTLLFFDFVLVSLSLFPWHFASIETYLVCISSCELLSRLFFILLYYYLILLYCGRKIEQGIIALMVFFSGMDLITGSSEIPSGTRRLG